MRSPALFLVLVAVLTMTACQSAADPTATPGASTLPASDTPSAPASEAPTVPSTPASEPPTAGSEEPIPSEELGEFSCDLPLVEDATVPIANIVDVRIGEQAGFDRVVFEFEQGIPELTLSRAEPPFAADGSGFPIEVDGESFLALVMRGGTKQTDAGTSSYDGPTEFEDEAPALVHLVEGGDFERQSTWYFGLADEACVRVLVLDEPHRLVIDIEH